MSVTKQLSSWLPPDSISQAYADQWPPVPPSSQGSALLLNYRCCSNRGWKRKWGREESRRGMEYRQTAFWSPLTTMLSENCTLYWFRSAHELLDISTQYSWHDTYIHTHAHTHMHRRAVHRAPHTHTVISGLVSTDYVKGNRLFLKVTFSLSRQALVFMKYLISLQEKLSGFSKSS